MRGYYILFNKDEVIIALPFHLMFFLKSAVKKGHLLN